MLPGLLFLQFRSQPTFKLVPVAVYKEPFGDLPVLLAGLVAAAIGRSARAIL